MYIECSIFIFFSYNDKFLCSMVSVIVCFENKNFYIYIGYYILRLFLFGLILKYLVFFKIYFKINEYCINL